MIIANGTIEVLYKQGGGIDKATGLPLTPIKAWSKQIECQYYPAEMNLQVRSIPGSNYAILKWVILIDKQPFRGEEIQLRNHDGDLIGLYAIKSIEALDAVCQIKITV
mgnify:CR=1 FL=1